MQIPACALLKSVAQIRHQHDLESIAPKCFHTGGLKAVKTLKLRIDGFIKTFLAGKNQSQSLFPGNFLQVLQFIKFIDISADVFDHLRRGFFHHALDVDADRINLRGWTHHRCRQAVGV